MTQRNRRKPITQLLLITIITLSALKAQEQKTPLTNWLQEFLDYYKVDKSATSKVNFIWKADVLKTVEKVRVVADFTSPITFMGVKTVKGNKQGESGIKECTKDQNCELGDPTTLNFRGKTFSNCYKAKLPIRLDGRQKLVDNSFKSDIILYHLKNESSPYTAGYGNFGLRYDSPFFDYISKAFVWPNDKIHLKLWINSMNNPANMAWSDEGYYTGSQITFNALPDDLVPNFDPKDYTWNKVEFDSDTKKTRWGLNLGTIYYGNDNKKLELSKGKVCFYPNSPLALYFKDKSKFDTLSKTMNKDVCGTEAQCPTGTKYQKNKANRVNFDFPGSGSGMDRMSLNPRDCYYDTGKELKYGYAYDSSLFATGGACEGFDVAIGGRFFSRYAIYIRMGLKKEKPEFLLVRQISPDKGPPIYSILLYVWLGFIGLLLYGCVFNHVLRKREAEVYTGGEQEDGNNFAKGTDDDLDDDEDVGYVR